MTTLQFQNLVPALYSFDSALALLGLRYGVDPLLPAFKAEGHVTDIGSDWTTSGQYLGQSLDWTVAGTFDPALDTLDWTGTGQYAGTPWALEGTTRWTSPTDFAIRDSISIGGAGHLFRDPDNPDFNAGTPAGSIEIGGTRYVKVGVVSPIPEPGAWLLMLSPPGVLAWLGRRGQCTTTGLA